MMGKKKGKIDDYFRVVIWSFVYQVNNESNNTRDASFASHSLIQNHLTWTCQVALHLGLIHSCRTLYYP